MVDWHMLPNEKKIHQTTMSWKVFMKFYLIVFLLIAVIAAILAEYLKIPFVPQTTALAVLGAVALVILIIAQMKGRREMILITTERILIRKRGMSGEDAGSGAIKMEAIPLQKLINVRVNQTNKQRLLGIGDVIFRLPGEEHTIKDVGAPFKIERAIYRIIEKEKEAGMRR